MISEIDIKDWEQLPLTKLHDLPRNTPIKTENGDNLFFHHLDGMYSLCEDKEGNFVHLAAWTMVYPLKYNA